jgi:ABC-type multidrug transport system fused ATPase/permease subunit
MWSNIKGMIIARDIDYGYKDDSFYLSIPAISKEDFKKNWMGWLGQSIILFFGPLYGSIFGFYFYFTEKQIPALGAACVFVMMLFVGIIFFMTGTKIRFITFFHDHLILSDKYLFGEKRIVKIQRHELPQLIIKKASDTEIPGIKDIELLLPFKRKEHKIISHRIIDDFKKIEEIFAAYRNGKSIQDLASDKNYSADRITDNKRYDIHAPLSELNRDIKRVTFLFLFHCFCCICGSLLSIPQATLGVAQIMTAICFGLVFIVAIYGDYINKLYIGKGEDYSVPFSEIPVWLKSICILSIVSSVITFLFSIDDFINAGFKRIQMNEATIELRLLAFSMFMFFSSMFSANNISELLNFKASKHSNM